MTLRFHRIALVCFAALAGLFEGPAQIACIVVILTSLASGQLRGFRPGILEIALGCWLLAGIPGIITSDLSPLSGAALRSLVVLAYVAGLAMAATDNRSLRMIALAFGTACVVNALYGCFQVFVFDPPLEQLILGRMSASRLEEPGHTGRLLMASGLFYNRLRFAHVGTIGLALLATALLYRPFLANRWTALVTVGAAILTCALFLTYRRAAPMALASSGAAIALFSGRMRVAAPAIIFAGTIGILFLTTQYGFERLETSNLALDQRLEVWRTSLALYSDHLVLGVGHGSYQFMIGPFTMVEETLRTSAHNLYIQTLCESGAVGFVCFIFGVGTALFRVLRRLRVAASEPSLTQARDMFISMALVCLLLLGFAHSILFHPSVGLLFWCLVGLAAGGRDTSSEARNPSLA